VVRFDLLDGGCGRRHEGFWSSACGLAQMRLDLSEGWLDGIEIGRVFRQELEAGVAVSDRFVDGRPLVTAEMIDHHDVTWPEGGAEALFGIGCEDLGVHRPVDHHRREDAAAAYGGDQGGGLPATMRDLGDEPLATRAAAMGPRHIGLGPGLVDEDQLVGRQLRLPVAQNLPSLCDVRPILLGGVQRFF
jgi:hypothetical protein